MLKTVKTAGAKGRAGRAGAVRRSRGRQEDGGAVEAMRPEREAQDKAQASSLPKRGKGAGAKPKDGRPRPTDAEIAGRLHGTRGRLFVRQEDGAWLDTETGATGTRAELEQAWLAER